MQKLRVGILGATGLVGQTYIKHLLDHPYFEVTFLAASKNSSGKTYQQAIESKNFSSLDLPSDLQSKPVYQVGDLEQALNCCDFVFSALPSKTALEIETLYASSGLPVLSNASSHRMDADVPILIPELNPEHLDILKVQQKNRGWKDGFIVTKSNCSIMSYLIPLFPLHQRFKIKKLMVTTLQAVSGAGYPGVASLDILNNVIPYIPQEEEKSEQEPLKILGSIQGNEIVLNKDLILSVHCNRVPVVDGHLACISVAFEKKPSSEEILEIWAQFKGDPQTMNLPSAPKQPIVYLPGASRPQPKRDVHLENGMAVSVGRLRKCPLFDYKFSALSHNLNRGAALGGILNAELLYRKGLLKQRRESLSVKLQSHNSKFK